MNLPQNEASAIKEVEDVNDNTLSQIPPEGSQRRKERRKSSKKSRLRHAESRSTVERRLRGGADDPPAEPSTEGRQEDVDDRRTTAASVSACASKAAVNKERDPLATTGDPRVDDLLERALSNLEEAGKALASLGENVEHDLKLFLVEHMSRTRKWMCQVEGKIEWTRRDVLDLHKEMECKVSALRDLRRDSDTLRDKLKGAELAKNLAQKSLADSLACGGPLGKVPSQARSVQMGPAMEQCVKSRSQCAGSDPNLNADVATLKAQQEDLVTCCAEMEAEILELRKENQRIVKERAEYESAIQRALLKGVSSLNVEALKVLRCTPIPTCCPPCPSTEIEPVKNAQNCGSPCPPSKPASPCGGGTSWLSGNNNNGGNNGGGCGGNSRAGTAKRPCPASAHSDRKSRRSKENNMLLLLHQKDAENFGIQTGGGCDNQSATTKKANICSGGGCGKGRSNNGC